MSHKRMVYLKGVANSLKLYNTLKACNIAEELHSGQKRKTGEPYVDHPMDVAVLLADLGLYDDKTLAGAILHDVCEDCNITPKELIFKHNIDPEVAEIVELLTHYKHMSDETYYTQLRENPSCILIKLADRNNNLSTTINIEIFPIEKIKEKYYETIEYILPLYQYGKKTYPEYSNQLRVIKCNIDTLLLVMKAYIRAFDKDFEREDKNKLASNNIKNSFELTM